MTNKYDNAFDDDHCSRWSGIPQEKLNADNRLHIEVLVRAMATGPWNIKTNWETANWRYGLGTSFVLKSPQLATYDNDTLTRLVVAAHDLGVRVQIGACTPKAIRVSMWTRPVREGSMGLRHPTLEDAAHLIRHGKPTPPKGIIARLLGK